MSNLGSREKPARVAVVGSGPSGFYAAEALQGAEQEIIVDMFDRLPAPFGLVRYGVAPDHPKIKNVTRRYEKTALNPSFSFIGNVDVGVDVSVEELRQFYDAIIFTSGAQTDRKLGIPGEDLIGSHPATEFVAWYNGHPDFVDYKFDLSRETAMVIGVGNVAVDVARILAKTVDELKDSDIAQHALDVLAESKIRDVHLVGRRGPVQAAFTPAELKELGELQDCDLVVDDPEQQLNEASRAELDDPKNRNPRKIVDLLAGFAARPAGGKSRRLTMHFLKSPVEITGDGRMNRVVLEKNELTGDPGRQKSSGTGVTEELDCGLLFRSVGYRGSAIPGVPFHEQWGIIHNEGGRVTDGGSVVPGLYTAGWIKRGPSGIIGTNKPCSIETARNLLEDLPSLEPCAERDSGKLLEQLAGRNIRVIDFAAWQKIDAAEIARGEAKGKPREKFVTVDEMLEAAGL
jgi:ferredoxin--NADP+ reductase